LSGTSSLTDDVDVTDSDASAGNEVSAVGSTDGGGNTNWSFAAAVVGDVNSGRIEANGLLVEDTGTNLCLQSEDFSTTWTTSRVTISTDSVSGPDGNSTADTIVASTNDNAGHFSQQAITFAATTQYTVSVYVKRSTTDWVAIRTNLSDSYVGAWFDLSDGTKGTVDAGIDDTTIEAVPGATGWYRISLTDTSVTGGSLNIRLHVCDADNSTDYVQTGEEVYAWGGDVKVGGTLTSYVPTTTGTVERYFDNIEYDNRNEEIVAGIEGAILVEYVPLYDIALENNSTHYVIAAGVDADDLIGIYWDQASGEYKFQVRVSGTNQALVGGGGTAARGVSQTLGITWKANEVRGFVDGVQVGVTDSSATVPALDSSVLVLGNTTPAAAATSANGHIKNVKTWKRALTVAEMAERHSAVPG